jgi:hypothetical protein
MGILASDLVPFSATGPTPLVPAAKDVIVKHFQVSRTDSTAAVKVVIPGDSTIIEISKYAGVNSDAGTSSTLTVTAANNTGVISTGTADLKTTGATAGHILMSNLPNIQPVPLLGDIKISASVAEVGAASTVGGPWFIKVYYIR